MHASLPHRWETWMEFQASGFSPDQPQHFGSKPTDGRQSALSLSLSPCFSFSLSLCLSLCLSKLIFEEERRCTFPIAWDLWTRARRLCNACKWGAVDTWLASFIVLDCLSRCLVLCIHRLQSEKLSFLPGT